jgi:hypothetical protein
MQLTKNFSLHELTKSDTADRLDIDNQPNEEQIESLRLLCENILQPVRDHFGKPVKITSGFRCSALNQPVILRLMAYPILSWQNGLKVTSSTPN